MMQAWEEGLTCGGSHFVSSVAAKVVALVITLDTDHS